MLVSFTPSLAVASIAAEPLVRATLRHDCFEYNQRLQFKNLQWDDAPAVAWQVSENTCTLHPRLAINIVVMFGTTVPYHSSFCKGVTSRT